MYPLTAGKSINRAMRCKILNKAVKYFTSKWDIKKEKH